MHVSPSAQVEDAVQAARQRPFEQLLPVAHWLFDWQSAVEPTPHAVPAPMMQRPLVQVWPLPQSADEAQAAAHWPATQIADEAQSEVCVQAPVELPGLVVLSVVLPPFGPVVEVVVVDPVFGPDPM